MKTTLTVVQIEKERAHVLVVNFASAIRLVLRNDLATIFRDKLVLLNRLLQENTPTSNVRRRHQQVLPCITHSFVQIKPTKVHKW